VRSILVQELSRQMFSYRSRRRRAAARFNRAIQGIFDTPPLQLTPGDLAIVSMVSNSDVAIYLASIKSFYPKIGYGKVVAIIDRAMPQSLRDTLSAHILGIEFIILEDIPTGACQRGGTWERLLYCLDRSEHEFTIQIDADVLTVGDDLSAVRDCIEANRSFTLADGFVRLSLPETVALARNTPSNYIGVVAEAALDRYSLYPGMHYIRGSSGFTGFAKGGFTRAQLTHLHVEMEQVVGAARWREWGTEQFGSNFAVANSPDPVVLPYPDYASFNGKNTPHLTTLFHFIGAYRFKDDYYLDRCREVIARLSGRPATPTPARSRDVGALDDDWPLLFTRKLTPESALRYLIWRLAGRRSNVVVQFRPRREFRNDPAPGPKVKFLAQKPGKPSSNGMAYEVFTENSMIPPVWVPPERVQTVVDLGANVGMSCLWWLANYWSARVIAWEPHPDHTAALRDNLALNGYTERVDLRQAAAGTATGRAFLSDEGPSSTLRLGGTTGIEIAVDDILAELAGRRIDILKIDIEGSEVALLEDLRFAGLDVGTLVMEWHLADTAGCGGRDWCRDRLHAMGYRTFIASQNGDYGIVWGYRDYSATPATGDEIGVSGRTQERPLLTS
jgi:FkbM family methyltransferase